MRGLRYRDENAASDGSAKALRLGAWYGTGQHSSRGLSHELFPEKGVDLEAKGADGKPLWRKRRDWPDGKVHNLPNRSNSATYMFRTITAPAATRMRVYLGSDDGIAVWLNDKRILFKDVSRGVGPDQENATLGLRAGENRLLMKVQNGGGGHGFYFSTKPGGGGGGRGGPVGPLADAAADFPVEYDWTLQDAGRDFAGWLDAPGVELEKRMIAKVLADIGAGGDRFRGELGRLEAAAKPNDPRWLGLYTEACEARRAKRLAPMLEKWKRIVFTKHHNMGGSHYAYTEAVSDAKHERNFRPNAALCIMEMEGTRAKVRTLIKDPGGVIRDPDVSYDGKRILFAWKKSDRQDDYHLYEMDVATEKVRQLTHGLGYADYEGCYLPNGDIVFSSSRCVQTVDCWWTRVSNLFMCDGDGKHMRRIGYDQVHTNYPKVMDDGRITYTRWDYNDRGQLYPQPLFQMNMEGTAQTEFYGNNSWFPTTIAHARGIPGTGKVLAIATGHHSYQRGKICIVDPTKGRQEASGVQLVAPVRETRAERIDGYGQHGDLFEYPYPLNEREFLVTYSPLGGRRPHAHFGVYFMDIHGRRELLASDPEIPSNQPVPLIPRRKPHVHPSVVDFSKKTGTYFVQDVYAGPGLKGIERGTVKKLRVVALDFRAAGVHSNGNGGPAGGALVSTPVSIRNGTWDVKIVLGTTPVYEDGSASFEVPARTPLYFQLLDEKNHVVQSMRSWSTLMPGESFSCVGCHEDKDNTPMLIKPAIAMRKGALPLEPFYGPARGFSFV
ncbi:MAG: HzsA-related protein, partial [Planctomycetota bacterium]